MYVCTCAPRHVRALRSVDMARDNAIVFHGLRFHRNKLTRSYRATGFFQFASAFHVFIFPLSNSIYQV